MHKSVLMYNCTTCAAVAHHVSFNHLVLFLQPHFTTPWHIAHNGDELVTLHVQEMGNWVYEGDFKKDIP